VIPAQDVLLLVSRVLMATMFLTSARDKFRFDATEVQQVASLHLPVPTLFLVLTGVSEGVGGVALVLGLYARVAAGALALFTAFVSLVFVRFWSLKGPPEMRTMMRNTFVGNVAITGGLIYVAVLGPGALALTGSLTPQG
jgi:putative oxidoreductase